jgi:hypothetical protein
MPKPIACPTSSFGQRLKWSVNTLRASTYGANRSSFTVSCPKRSESAPTQSRRERRARQWAYQGTLHRGRGRQHWRLQERYEVVGRRERVDSTGGPVVRDDEQPSIDKLERGKGECLTRGWRLCVSAYASAHRWECTPRARERMHGPPRRRLYRLKPAADRLIRFHCRRRW